MDTDVRRPAQTAGRSPDPVVAPPVNTQSPADANEVFRTPEEVAAEDTLRGDADWPGDNEQLVLPPSGAASGSKGGWREKLTLHWPPGRKEWLTFVVLVLLIGGGTFFWVHGRRQAPVVAAPATVVKPPKSTTVPSTLSGLPVDPSVNKLPVTGVMVENSLPARPQSGLSQAMVVFEAVAEGGVTRFLALYQDTSPNSVGPIRSARPYYEQWALGFDAGYAHVGGSPDALTDIKDWGVRDLDQFYNSGYYQRVSSRPAPHNVYTSISKLNQLENSKGYTTSTFTGFPRQKAAPAKQPTARTIDLTLSGPDYNVHYDYDAATNSYNRSEGGAPQIDANTNKQISPTVVIAMVVPESNGSLDSSGAYYSDYDVIGSGPVDVFQNGTVTTGTWSKSSNTSQITFTDAAGQPIKLNAGQTWLTAVTATSKVGYAS